MLSRPGVDQNFSTPFFKFSFSKSVDFENSGPVVLLFYGIPNSPFARVGGYYNDKVMEKGPPGGAIAPLKENPPACNRFRTFEYSTVARWHGTLELMQTTR